MVISLFSPLAGGPKTFAYCRGNGKVGYWSMEVWGGATFDTMHRFLNEDPWERPRELKKYLKKTKLMMLLRGQNLVGYRNYADDMAAAFV